MNKYNNIVNKHIYNLIQIPKCLMEKEKISNINDCNLEYMAQISYEQFILPFFYDMYFEYMDKNLSKLCLNQINKYKDTKKAQLKLLQMIKAEFECNKIDYMLIKGFALSEIIYDNEYQRWFGDLDIIIDLEDFKKADEIMKTLGFKSVLGNINFPDISKLDCYEIEYEYDLNSNFCISVELKIATSSVKDINLISHFKNNKIKINIDNYKYDTLNINDTFILICTNTYSNFEIEFASIRLREVFDLYYFLKKYINVLDWKYIFNISAKYKLTHKIYAILILINKFYAKLTPDKIINLFLIEKIKYDKICFNNYSHGWMRDWNISKLDIMINKKDRLNELFYALSLKSYTSQNCNFDNMIIVEDLGKNNFREYFEGIKSEKNEFEFTYSFCQDKDNIYLNLKFDLYNYGSNIRTVFLVHDIDRETPRKMIEFFYVNNNFKCHNITKNLRYAIIETKKNEITISIEKNNFHVLQNKGHMLSYRFYSVIKCGNIDFAIRDDRKMFDFENPNIIYLNQDNISQIVNNIKENGLFYNYRKIKE